MSVQPIIFLNSRRAESGIVDADALPGAYVDTCRFLHCSMLDRTHSTDPGFAYRVLDPIPAPDSGIDTFARLCDERGREIVSAAQRSSAAISVLWSGGIDSTCALIAVVKAARQLDSFDSVEVWLSANSVAEYPRFFLRHIDGKIAIRPVSHPIAAFLDPSRVNVTGEHGDQLFGSHLLAPYVQKQLAHRDYRDVLPLVLLQRLRNPVRARRVYQYVRPVIAAAPVPIRTFFDCMWWLNFALKWQEVTLRMAIFCGAETGAVTRSLTHFFRTGRFQQWALTNTPGTEVGTWRAYKRVAKQYILNFTDDERYFRTKEKEDSLRNVLVGPEETREIRVHMRTDFKPVIEIAQPNTLPWFRRGAGSRDVTESDQISSGGYRRMS